MSIIQRRRNSFDLDTTTSMYFATKSIFTLVAIIHLFESVQSDFECNNVKVPYLQCCRDPTIYEVMNSRSDAGWRFCQPRKFEKTERSDLFIYKLTHHILKSKYSLSWRD